jgi:alternate signal-mediated exported protein
MKKATKGALAAVAAGSLLVGGAGSLAFWTGTATISGATISSGNLTLGAVDCDPGVGTGSVWTIDGATAFDPATQTIVPGDTLTKVCTTTLTLTGSHIGATLAVDDATFGATTGLSAELDPEATFTVNGAPYAPITEPGSYAVAVTVSVPFDATATNASKGLSAALNAITIAATQTHSA